MVGILDSAPGVTIDQAAAMAIFRVATIVFEVVIGVLVYLLVWRRSARRRSARLETATP